MRQVVRLLALVIPLFVLALLPATESITTTPSVSAAVEGPIYDPTCSDSIDNDSDTRVDLADPGCTYSSELYLSTPNFPVNLTFTPDGRLFYNERCGSVRVITAAGALLPTPFVTIPNVSCSGDHGLTGLELDPDYSTNHYVYVGYVKQISSNPNTYQPFIERFTDVDNIGTNPTMIIGNLPTKTYVSVGNPGDRHGLNNIHFGPDGKLYVSIGDYWEHTLTPPSSQDLSKPIGKLLRVNKEDGSAPPDNPFVGTPGADPRIFAYGFRNSFDFAFHPQTGAIFMTENGPEACDELNLVVAGGNYEWPYGFQWTEPPADPDHPLPMGPTCEGGVGIPAIHYFPWNDDQADAWMDNSTTSPVGILGIDGDQFPALGHSLFVCTYRNIVLRHMTLSGAPLDDIGQDVRVIDDNLTACLVDVEMSPGGDIYFTQSNHIRRLIIDSDADGVEDNDDNCDSVANPGQDDYDADSEGDACDGEDDGDGFDDAAEAQIGTGPLDPCGADGWPAELAGDDNTLNIGDLNSFLFPLRDLNGNTIPGEPGLPPTGDDDGTGVFNKFNHPVPDINDENIARWNLIPDGTINIGDPNALNPGVTAPTSRPPMFGGEPAFFTNGGVCPYLP